MKISSQSNFVEQQSNLNRSNLQQPQRLNSSAQPPSSAEVKSIELAQTHQNNFLSSINTSSAHKASEDSSEQGGLGNITSIEGKNTILILDDSLKSERMLKVYNRLPSADQELLLDTNLISDDDFLDLADQLDDTQLAEYMSVAQALQKAPALNSISGVFISSQTLDIFTQKLLDLEPPGREQVLAQGKIHAAKVPVTDPDQIYTRQALQGSHSDTAGHDIRNFVLAVNNSTDVPAMIEDLQLFSPAQQSDLLAILPYEEVADRVMEQLGEMPEVLVDSALSFFADTVQKLDSSSPLLARESDLKGVSTILNFDNNSSQTRFNMLEQSLSLMENYDFGEQQLGDMLTAVQGLDVSNQRAYLEITERGLDLLAGGSQSSEKVDLQDNVAVIQAIEEVRSSSFARDLVFKARMGESHTSDSGTQFYAIKAQGKVDQGNSIDLLVGSAFVQINAASTSDSQYQKGTANLAEKLLKLGADERDQLSGQVSGELDGQGPLDQIEKQQLTDQLAGFSQRASALASTEDIDTLLLAQQQVDQHSEGHSSDDFWQAADAAAENVDQYAELLLQNNAQLQQQMISLLTDNHPAQTPNDEVSAAKNIDAMFTVFQEAEDKQKIANFFTRMGY